MAEIAQTVLEKPAGNPLANYFRQPKIYIRLPSEGQFYPQGRSEEHTSELQSHRSF
jgi:hypothetical protein